MRSFEETSALLPIDTNAESPRPRDSHASSKASPRAPLWDEKPMLPAGAERAAKVALSPTAADEIPRQFGPRSRAPCARIIPSSPAWRSTPSAPISANPADDADGLDARIQRGLHCVENPGSRHAH